MRPDPVRAALLGALFAAIVTLPGLGGGTLWDNSETTYGEVAREIGLTHDWVVMHLNGHPWFIQPPLYFWLAALIARVVGTSEFALRLPSALATIAMGGAVGYATARIAGVRAGTVAAAVLSTALMQAIVGRLAIMDALLDLCVAAAILWWFRALQPVEGDGLAAGKRATAFVCGSAALAFGMLAKGPVAPAIVLLVIGVWLGWESRSGSRPVRPSAVTLVASVALFAAIALPWFVAEVVRAGPAAARELIVHYTIGRYTGVIENQRGPWWYYIPVLMLGFFPWIAFVPVALARATGAARAASGSFERLALCWIGVPLVFFSCAQTKLPNYVALLLPALAIVVALWFERVAAGADRRAAIVSAATIPLFVAALGIAAGVFVRTNRLEAVLGAVASAFGVLAVVMVAGSLATVLAAAVPRWTAAAPYLLAATAGSLVLFIALVGEPAAEKYKPIPVLARAIDAHRANDGVVAVRGASGGIALIYYTAPVVRELGNGIPEFETFACAVPQGFVVTRTGDGPELVQAARDRGRHAEQIATSEQLTAVQIDGPPCRV